MTACVALLAWLDMLFAGAAPGSLIEIRYKLGGGQRGMGQLWVPCDRPQVAAEQIDGLGRRTDVYAGVAPRRDRHGGLRAIHELHTLWADCDGPESLARLAAFESPPSIVVASGTPHHAHAYWGLDAPISPVDAVALNKRLAAALGADPRATDAARILRPPGTRNHKGAEPVPVNLTHLDYNALYSAEQLAAHAPPLADGDTAQAPRPSRPAVPSGDDSLLAIPSAVYVPALTGREVGADRKVQCPWHGAGAERTPSFEVFDEPERGWRCFGCEPAPGATYAGGSIIDFGARWYGISPRGAGYCQIRDRLRAELLQALKRAAA